MDTYFFELLLAAFTALLSAVVSVVWAKADHAAKTAETNKATLSHLEKQLDKTNELTQRLSSLEASFNAEIKNLSVSIKRMEGALIRIDQNGQHRTR